MPKTIEISQVVWKISMGSRAAPKKPMLNRVKTQSRMKQPMLFCVKPITFIQSESFSFTKAFERLRESQNLLF